MVFFFCVFVKSQIWISCYRKLNTGGWGLLRFVRSFGTITSFILQQSLPLDQPVSLLLQVIEFMNRWSYSVIWHQLPTIVGGSLFLFDRKVLRYFRKDGHNWRKKKDGKTIKEAHEKLKVRVFFELALVVVCVYSNGTCLPFSTSGSGVS